MATVEMAVEGVVLFIHKQDVDVVVDDIVEVFDILRGLDTPHRPLLVLADITGVRSRRPMPASRGCKSGPPPTNLTDRTRREDEHRSSGLPRRHGICRPRPFRPYSWHEGPVTQGSHEIRIATVHMGDDGVVRYVGKQDISVTAADIEELLDVLETIGGGAPLLVLSDITGVRSASGEARRAAASDRAAALHIASGIVVRSAVARVIGNFFIRLNRPTYPTRLFTSEAPALEWLLDVRRTSAGAA